MIRRQYAAFCLMLILTLVGCTAPQASKGSAANPEPNPPAKKRITAGILANHPTLISRFERGLPGAESLEAIVNPGLTVANAEGTLIPVLAQDAPTIENGLWQVSPDGRMQITWKLKP